MQSLVLRISTLDKYIMYSIAMSRMYTAQIIFLQLSNFRRPFSPSLPAPLVFFPFDLFL